MAAVAEGLLLRTTTAAELGVLYRLNNSAIGIDKLDLTSDSNRTTVWIDECLNFFAHNNSR